MSYNTKYFALPLCSGAKSKGSKSSGAKSKGSKKKTAEKPKGNRARKNVNRRNLLPNQPPQTVLEQIQHDSDVDEDDVNNVINDNNVFSLKNQHDKFIQIIRNDLVNHSYSSLAKSNAIKLTNALTKEEKDHFVIETKQNM